MGAPRETLSAKNPRIAHLRRLSGRRRSRAEHGQFIVEGATLVAEAFAAGSAGSAGTAVDSVYVDLDAPESELLRAVLHEADVSDTPVFWLEPGVLTKVADAVSPQPVLAVVSGVPLDLDSWIIGAPSGLVLVLAGLRDPGNAGTLVRTAEAVGAAAVIFAGDAVDPLSPKTVRASAGSVLRVPVVAAGDLVGLVGSLRANHFRIASTAMSDAVPYTDADLRGDLALILGNEAHGVDPDARCAFDVEVSIPMLGQVESLNVAVAGSLIAFASARQRAGAA